MAESSETKEESPVLLSSNYGISTDKLNLILKEKYEKREGKGKFAEFSGETGWRDLGYFQSLTHIGDHLVKKELMKEHEITELRHYAEVIERLRDDIVDTLSEKVEVIKG